MLLIKYWRHVFSKQNKKFLIFISLAVEVIALLIFLALLIFINLFTNDFKLIFFIKKNIKIYLYLFLFLQFFFVPILWYVFVRKKYLRNIKSEDLVKSKSFLERERFTEWIIDDRKLIPQNKNMFHQQPTHNHSKSVIAELEKYYPNPAKSESIGLLVRNFYNKKAKRLEQNVTAEEHVAIMGTSGGGKSALIVKPTLLYFIDEIKRGKKISSFVFDPKGDLYTMVYKELENSGIKSYMLDLDNAENSCGYNYLSVVWDQYHEAFDYLKNDLFFKTIKTEATLQSYTHTSSKCFAHNSKPCQDCYEILSSELKENGSVKLYFNTIKNNLEFSQLKYFTNDEEVENYKLYQHSYLMNLATTDLEQLYMEFVPDHMDSNNGTYFTASPRKWLVTFSLLLLELNIASGGMIVTKEEFNLATIAWILSKPKEALEWLDEYKTLDGAENSKAVQIIEILKIIPQDNQGSFLIEISNRLNVFNNELIKKVTSPMEVDIQKMFKEPTMFFVKLEPNKIQTQGVLVTILCNQIYNEQRKYIERKRAVNPKDDALDVTWINLLDEFSNLPPVLELESKLSFCRSSKIFWYMFIQEKEQLKSRYNETTQKIILSQARTTIYLMGDAEAKDYVVRNAGKRKIIKHNVDYEKNQKSGVSDGSEDLITVDELKLKPFPTMVVLNQNKPPMFSYMMPIFEYAKAKDIEGNPLLTETVPLIPTSNVFNFNWNQEGKFNVYEFDCQKFNLNLINPEFYKDAEGVKLANELMLSFKTIIDPLEAFALNGDEILEMSGTEVLETIDVLIKKYIEAPDEEREEIIEEINSKINDLSAIAKKIADLNKIRKKRNLTKVEKKEYLDCQKLFFELNRKR